MIRRRIIAGALILMVAVGSPFFWQLAQGTPVDTYSIIQNCAVGAIALAALHFRWRINERRQLTPKQTKDTFS